MFNTTLALASFLERKEKGMYFTVTLFLFFFFFFVTTEELKYDSFHNKEMMLQLHVEEGLFQCTCLYPTMSSGGGDGQSGDAKEQQDDPIRAKARLWIVLLPLISGFWAN